MAIVRSLFSDFVEKYFAVIVGEVTKKINDQNKEQTLMHKSMLTEEYSADMTWKSIDINQSVVAADVVSLGSRLPLKKRDTLSRAEGRLPKLGIKFRKDEKDIADINIMIARGAQEQAVAGKILNDVPRAIKGVDLRNEIAFLEGLSTGMYLVESDTNDGTGIRVDFGYKAENTFHAITAKWGTARATTITDLQQLFDKASKDGNSIQHVWISEKRFNNIRSSAEGKDLAARYLDFVTVSTPPRPKRNTMLDALKDEFGATFHVVDVSVRIEKPDGTYTSVKPYAEDNVIATPTDNVGRLVYGTLAEETNPVADVLYEKSGSYTLVSKFSNNEPLEEFTSAQAICLPVIDGVNSIYVLHTDSTDSTLSLDPATLSVEAAGGTDTVDIHYEGSLGDLTITSSQTFVTANRRGDKITVKTAANSGSSSRSATVTVTDGTASATITVTQAAAS